jgi:hypothetical protein
MAWLWMIGGFVAIVLITSIISMYWGRGHLGVDQSQRHYLDECESMYHWNGF